MNDEAPFRSGDRVVRKTNLWKDRYKKFPIYSDGFTVHICEKIHGRWWVFDVYLNNYLADNCIPEGLYKSPLWEIMNE